MGKPFIVHAVSQLLKAGITDFHVVVNEEGITPILKDAFPDASFREVMQGEPKGTGHAVGVCADRIKKDFLVVAADTLFDHRIVEELVAKGTESKAEGTVTGKWIENSGDYGFVKEENGRIKNIEEKPSTPLSGYANASLYFFRQSMMDRMAKLKPSPRGELEITDALGGMELSKTDKFWVDIGYPWKLFDALGFLFTITEQFDHSEKTDSEISGKVFLEKGVTVRRSVIEGPVYIGAGTKIGPHSLVKGASNIEGSCDIGESTTIKNSIVLSGTNAKHLAYIGDSVIGENCNFGSSTQIANFRFDSGFVKANVNGKLVSTKRRKMGALIGSSVKTGVNSTIYPGRIIGNNAWIYPGTIITKNVPDRCRVCNVAENSIQPME